MKISRAKPIVFWAIFEEFILAEFIKPGIGPTGIIIAIFWETYQADKVRDFLYKGKFQMNYTEHAEREPCQIAMVSRGIDYADDSSRIEPGFSADPIWSLEDVE